MCGLGWALLGSGLPSRAKAVPEAQEMVSGGREEKPCAAATRIGVFKNSAPGLNRALLFSSFFLLWTSPCHHRWCKPVRPF